MGGRVIKRQLGKVGSKRGFCQRFPKLPSSEAALIKSICTGVALLTALSTAKFSADLLKFKLRSWASWVSLPNQRINRTVNKLGGNTEQKHARQYGNQGKHPDSRRAICEPNTLLLLSRIKSTTAHQHYGTPATASRTRRQSTRNNRTIRCCCPLQQSDRTTNYGKYGGNQEKAAHGFTPARPTRISNPNQMPVFRR